MADTEYWMNWWVEKNAKGLNYKVFISINFFRFNYYPLNMHHFMYIEYSFEYKILAALNTDLITGSQHAH